MEKIVNNLLGFSRAVKPVLAPGDINMIINECLLFVQPQFRKKNISVKKILNPSLPNILMDENLLKEGIINLIINSEQAIKTNGEIFVSTDLVIQKTEINDFAYVDKVKRSKTVGQYKINLPKGSQLIKIEIHDNGVGIAKQNLHKIFDPFFTTKSGGSGLGLAMVKRTINQHGGVVLVESGPKDGTTFTILLPLWNAYEE
jgi:signal transduction histidine kinase